MDIFTTMITPFTKDGEVDYETALKYVDWYFESGRAYRDMGIGTSVSAHRKVPYGAVRHSYREYRKMYA